MANENTLSNREEEILQLVATGMTNREIAQQLTISPNTVKVHLSNIYEKLQVASRTEATLYGIEHGIVDVPGGETESAPPEELPQWRILLDKYMWVWVSMVFVLLVAIVTVGVNLLTREPNPEEIALADAEARWQELSPMPVPRAGMAAVAYDGDIYAIAGEGPEGVRGTVFRYNPEDDTWETLSDKPTPVTDVKGALIGEKIYVPGGLTEDGIPTDILEIYDPRTDTWEVGASLPNAVSAYALADFEGQLYLFGGWDGEGALADVIVYDPVDDEWRDGTPMEIARYDGGAVSLADKIVVLGGRNEEGALKEAQAYFPSRDGNGESPWEQFPPLPEAIFGFGVASVSESVYVVGGKTFQESGHDSQSFVYANEGWISFDTNKDYSGEQIELVFFGSSLFIVNPAELLNQTQLWEYQVYYFSIYIPFAP
jgi:DNA-binding CsgD family transcriptional regulator/N-acetylneuraminic acid mutarotase